ncbi:MAG: CPBP family intramembrane metalloprotease [Acidobacteriia bacterium]|nr:CPBP family intramembrane metalloprotease [Terriglobia bacterium]
MNPRKDPLRLAIRLGVFLISFLVLYFLTSGLFSWLLQDFAGPILAELASALCATWLALRIYEACRVIDVGLWWNRAAGDNLTLGLSAGVAAACLVTGLPLLLGWASIVRDHPASGEGIVFAVLCLAAGAVGEEIVFRGYGLQILIAGLGPWAAVIPIGLLFGLLHAANPDATSVGVINTAAFGVLFGYAYLRSRDLWLPIGLHFGWNVTLPLFGANLSGIKIFREITGHEMAWRAGTLWSGGEYGPEASLLTSLVFIPLFVFLWKAPIRRQTSPLTDRPAEGAICESSPPSAS